MNLERFTAVRALFEQVVDLPADQRESVLRSQSDDEDIIKEVLALCRWTERSSTTQLSSPRDAMLQSATAPVVKPGDSLGVWRIIRPLGEGGMGKVFLVERNDGHFQQTAALKFLKGLPRAETLDYFTRERQLLASLAHPNIARLFDGGATDTGQPYLVMEYVDGLPIDAWCRAQRLDVRSLLTLFIRACDAVAFAHRQLIVHCDIKPSNLLIEKGGRPVLLDFGIATLMDRVGATTTTGIVPSGVAFTPRYASPEQREQGLVSTASDIYSLGVLLRELLDAVTPSTQRVTRSPDIAAMLALATHQDPAQRYATVDAFTDDIQRFLDQEPVRALPPTPLYVTRKWLTRRWPVALAAGVFGVTVAGFTAQVLVESQRAQSAEQRALADRDRAQAAEQQALRERDATRQAQAETLRERDGAQAARNDAVQERDRAAQAERIAAQQRDRARAAEAGAVADRDIARKAEAAAVAERNRATQAESRARQTNEFLVSIFDATDPNAETGDIPASKLIATASERIGKEMDGQPDLQATLWGVMAKVQSNMGGSERARDDYLRAIEVERKLDRPLELAMLLHNLAMLRVSELGTPGAEAEAREALELFRKHAPGSADVANATSALGHLLSSLGRYDEAGKLIQEALALHDAANPPHDGHAATLMAAGQHAMRTRNQEAAISYYKRAIQLRGARLGPDHPRVLVDEEIYVQALRATRKLDEAETLARRILALRLKQDGKDSSNVATILNELGRVLYAKGKLTEAIDLYEQSAAMHAKRNGKQSTRYAVMLNNIAVAHIVLGNLQKSAELMKESVDIVDVVVPGDTDLTKASFFVDFGIALIGARRHQEALAPIRRGNATYAKALKPSDPKLVESELYLAEAELHSGSVDAAAARLARQDSVIASLGLGNKLLHRRLNALVLARRGQLDDAIDRLTAIDAERQKASVGRTASVWIPTLDRADLLLQRASPGDRDTAREVINTVLVRLEALGTLQDAPAVLRAKALLAR